tara:strand:- start:310 stop:1101 length:792 start_codon:yes stop_codon:yes gene_type:complete
MGAALPEREWVPSPMYILRRAAILDWLQGMPTGRVIEFGCGPGALLHDLSKLGFHGIGVERSPTSLELSRDLLRDAMNFKVVPNTDGITAESADYLFSFEVLEHIENDAEALRMWLTFLKPGGSVLISVPAHSHRWNLTDVNAGHFRRYDRPDVIELLQAADLVIERIGTYGWPASRMIEYIRERTTNSSMNRAGETASNIEVGDPEKTMASGFNRKIETRFFKYYGSWLGQILFMVAARMQRFFYRTDLGVSFIVHAKKPNA